MVIVKYTGKEVAKEDMERVQHLIVGKEYLVISVHNNWDAVLYGILEVNGLISSSYFERVEDQSDMDVILNMVKSLSNEMLDNEYEKRENPDKKTSSGKIMDSILPKDVICYEMSRRARIYNKSLW